MSRLVFWHLTLIFDHVTLNRNHLLSRTNQCTKLSKYQAKYSLNIEQAIQMSEIQQCDSDLSPHHSKNVHASNNPQNVQSQSLSTGNSLSPHLNPSHSHVCINPSYIFSITKREIHILIYPCSKHAYIQQKEDNSFKFILCLKHLKFISWQQLYIYLLKNVNGKNALVHTNIAQHCTGTVRDTRIWLTVIVVHLFSNALNLLSGKQRKQRNVTSRLK